MMNGSTHSELPMFATGTSIERRFSAGYATACWIAWPASCAATAIDDTERPS